MEIRNGNLIIDGHSVGNEEYVLALLDKAVKYDELYETFFNGGDA